ncbi:MAG: HIT family protein [Parvularculaceae bacterium]|nr:MAG: HIT family protein [Parvularculaceae bacterium]
MSLDTKYEDNNIFAKIINGDLPCVKIYEDENILSFMDIFPQTEGHCLVIHKKAASVNILDMPTDALAEVILIVQKVARAATAALSPDGVRIVQFNGASAGQTVFHTHFHVIPTNDGMPESNHASGSPHPTEELEAVAAKIRAAL